MSTVSGVGLGPVPAFNPRLRLDLSSGKGSLQTLNNNIGQLPSLPGTFPAAATPLGPEVHRHAAIDYDRAVALMLGRHTQGMHERHVATLHKISSLNGQGFFFSDAGHIAELLSLAGANLASGRQEYAPALCEMLQVLSAPLHKLRCNDDERFEKGFVSLVREVGSLVALAHTQVSVAGGGHDAYADRSQASARGDSRWHCARVSLCWVAAGYHVCAEAHRGEWSDTDCS